MCMILKEIYSEVFQEEFDYEDFEKRVKLQKAVYILEGMGLNIGDYSFSWATYGPYSLRLDGDALRCMQHSIGRKPVFSEFAEKCIQRLKVFLDIKEKYGVRQWVECIASLHFLSNTCHYEKENALKILSAKKPYLDNTEENEKAFTIAESIRERE